MIFMSGGKPLVVQDPSSSTSGAFMELGAAVVREISKLKAAPKASLRYRDSIPNFWLCEAIACFSAK